MNVILKTIGCDAGWRILLAQRVEENIRCSNIWGHSWKRICWAQGADISMLHDPETRRQHGRNTFRVGGRSPSPTNDPPGETQQNRQLNQSSWQAHTQTYGWDFWLKKMVNKVLFSFFLFSSSVVHMLIYYLSSCVSIAADMLYHILVNIHAVWRGCAH